MNVEKFENISISDLYTFQRFLRFWAENERDVGNLHVYSIIDLNYREYLRLISKFNSEHDQLRLKEILSDVFEDEEMECFSIDDKIEALELIKKELESQR